MRQEETIATLRQGLDSGLWVVGEEIIKRPCAIGHKEYQIRRAARELGVEHKQQTMLHKELPPGLHPNESGEAQRLRNKYHNESAYLWRLPACKLNHPPAIHYPANGYGSPAPGVQS
ncbi:MAG: hypothetical protein ACLPHP_22390 [Candidatus Sulfotelmatobacter sp.]